MVTLYISNQQNEKATDKLIELMNLSGLPDDAGLALNFCAYKKASKTEDCISESENILTSKVNVLDFRQAYSSGVNLEYLGKAKSAATLYQRAVNVYDKDAVDEYTKSEAELKKYVDANL